MVGFYLGTMGELEIPSSNGFKLLDAATGNVVHEGALSLRKDVGYGYSPTPYQKVYEADFSGFNTPASTSCRSLASALPIRFASMKESRHYMRAVTLSEFITNAAEPRMSCRTPGTHMMFATK
jgi:hypothetical protein